MDRRCDQPAVCPVGPDLEYRHHPAKPALRTMNPIFADIRTPVFAVMGAIACGYACPSTLLLASPGSIGVQRDIRLFYANWNFRTR